MKRPEAGDVFIHYKSKRKYRVMCRARWAGDQQVGLTDEVVVYVGVDDRGKLYWLSSFCRPMAEFQAVVRAIDGSDAFVPRFTYVQPPKKVAAPAAPPPQAAPPEETDE